MDSSSGDAMASANASCPVLSAWANSRVVMSQLLKDKLVILQYPHLTRDSLADNVDLLAPVINLLGPLD